MLLVVAVARVVMGALIDLPVLLSEAIHFAQGPQLPPPKSLLPVSLRHGLIVPGRVAHLTSNGMLVHHCGLLGAECDSIAGSMVPVDLHPAETDALGTLFGERQ